jgi:cell division protein FtsZ
MVEIKKEALKFEVQEEALLGTRIKVIGVGGGGSNAVARMMSEGVTGVEFHVLNTDAQALRVSPVPNKLAIGSKVTNGLGAGADPSIGRLAALEDTERIIEILEGADMIFVTAGMGGGTGTGAAPVVAALAKELNALTVAVVTKPFGFEGPRRMKQADKGLADLASSVDTVISIPNDKLLTLVPKGTSFYQAFRVADDVLRQAVQGIAEIITTPGVINRDFSDIKAIMLGMGFAMMGSATAKGENALVEAAKQAINSALLEEGGVKGARGILINITGSSKLSLHDVNEACALIRAAAEYDDVQINFGIVLDESLDDEAKITVIATGFQRAGLPAVVRSSMSDQVLERATEPKFTAAPEPQFADRLIASEPRFETVDQEVGREAEIVVEGEVAVAAAVAEAPAKRSDTSSAATPEEAKNDLELPAFMRRERRLFQ